MCSETAVLAMLSIISCYTFLHFQITFCFLLSFLKSIKAGTIYGSVFTPRPSDTWPITHFSPYIANTEVLDVSQLATPLGRTITSTSRRRKQRGLKLDPNATGRAELLRPSTGATTLSIRRS